MIDSQAVKNTCNAIVETKGFCFYKCTNGIKRHLATDSLGFPKFAHCTPAHLSDDQGLIELLTRGIDYFKLKPSELPNTIFLYSGLVSYPPWPPRRGGGWGGGGLGRLTISVITYEKWYKTTILVR